MPLPEKADESKASDASGGGGGTRLHIGLQDLLKALRPKLDKADFENMLAMLQQVRAKQKAEEASEGKKPDKRVFMQVIAKLVGVDTLKQAMRDAQEQVQVQQRGTDTGSGGGSNGQGAGGGASVNSSALSSSTSVGVASAAGAAANMSGASENATVREQRAEAAAEYARQLRAEMHPGQAAEDYSIPDVDQAAYEKALSACLDDLEARARKENFGVMLGSFKNLGLDVPSSGGGGGGGGGSGGSGSGGGGGGRKSSGVRRAANRKGAGGGKGGGGGKSANRASNNAAAAAPTAAAFDFGQGGHIKDGTESGKPPLAGASAETSTSGAGGAGAATIASFGGTLSPTFTSGGGSSTTAATPEHPPAASSTSASVGASAIGSSPLFTFSTTANKSPVFSFGSTAAADAGDGGDGGGAGSGTGTVPTFGSFTFGSGGGQQGLPPPAISVSAAPSAAGRSEGHIKDVKNSDDDDDDDDDAQ